MDPVSVCSDLDKLCPMRTPSPSMHLCPRWNTSIWDAESIKVDQTGRFLCSQDGSCLSSGVICMHRGKGLFCKGGFVLNITSKETLLPAFPPPVASLQQGKLLSLPVVWRSAYCCSALFEGFSSFLPACFLQSAVCSRLYLHQTGVGSTWDGRAGFLRSTKRSNSNQLKDVSKIVSSVIIIRKFFL